MANNASNFLEDKLFSVLFRSDAAYKPTNICFGLTVDDPTGNEGAYNEVANAGAYARVPGASGAAFWDAHGNVGPAYNLQAITFAQATADWGMVSGVIIMDSDTYGAGNMLMQGPLTTARDVRSGDTFQINVSGCSIQIT